MGNQIQGSLRKLGICEKWIWISVIITTESHDYTGNISDCLIIRILICYKEIGGIIYGFEMDGIWSFSIYCVFDNPILWKTWDLRYNQVITFEIFGINGGKYWRREMRNWIQYKKFRGSLLCCITLLSSLAISYNKKNKHFLFFGLT